MSIPDPAVLLDARARYVHPAFQMTRASTKTVFDAAGRMVTVPPNAIGWDHDPATGESQGCLLDPSATNLLLHSNDLTQGAWIKSNLSVSAAAIIGPDGKGMAKLVEDTSTGSHVIDQEPMTITDGSNNCFSIYLRAAERSQVELWVYRPGDIFGTRVRARLELTDGSVVSTLEHGDVAVAGAGSKYVGDGIYRFWVSVSLGEGVTTAGVRVAIMPDWNYQYEGDGTSGVYIGYAQVEPGEMPTSYIETGETTVLRPADDLLISDVSVFASAFDKAGTIAIDTADHHLNDGILMRMSSSRVQKHANEISWQLRGSEFSGWRTFPDTNRDGRKLIAVSWDMVEGLQVAGGGVLSSLAPVNSGFSPTAEIGFGPINSVGRTHVRRVVFYPARISNADLQSLTALQE